jgi:hypothetical protein
MTLTQKIVRLERLTVPRSSVQVWWPAEADESTVVSAANGERLSVEQAQRLGAGHIVVLYIDTPRQDHDADEAA